MTNLNAAVGLAQIERLEEMLHKRRQIFNRYNEALATSQWLTFAPTVDWAESNCWMSAVMCKDRQTARHLVEKLGRSSISASLFWHSLADQTAYRHYPRVSRPQAKVLSETVVALPCSSHLTDSDQDRVIRHLEDRS